jgi:wyosine [tRNA(Phe)-imidazoG37] synthetase (radical SAM superfamily)
VQNSLEILSQYREHSRLYRHNRYVYPVVSRRSKGLSIGINLNPDKICNFDCVYCQVDRRSDAEVTFVDVDRLYEELVWTIDRVLTGRVFEEQSFVSIPAALRRLNDLAFSGDGEPTSVRNFAEIVEGVARIKRTAGLDDVKLIVLTNASLLHRPRVMRGLETLMANNGEIWAKLDAGTPEYFQVVERTPIPFERILKNLRQTARQFPLVIQSMFLRLHGRAPEVREVDAYIDRLQELLHRGGALKLIQVYTLARRPAESYVAALDPRELDWIADRVRQRLPVPVEAFYGPV